jgi:hypothetical protein
MLGVGVRGLRYLLLTALLVALLFSSASLPSYGARLPQSDSLSIVDWYWGRPETKVDAGPGDERVPLTVVLVNTRKEAVFGVAAELRTSGPFRPHGGGGAVAYSAGPARSGDAVFLTFELDVSPDASPGSYRLEVYVRYNYVDSKGELNSATFLDSIEVELKDLPGRPELLDVGWAAGSPPEPGSLGKLTVVLGFRERLPITRLSAELKLPEGLRGSDGSDSVVSVAGQAGGTVFTASFDVVPLHDVPSRVTAELKVEYVLEWGTKRSFVYRVEVLLRGRPGLELRLEPTTLVAGTVNPIRLQVGNSGTEVLRNVVLTFSTQPGSPLTLLKGSRVELREVNVGELVLLEGALEVYASPNAPEGPVTLTVRAEFFDGSGVKRVETRELGLAVTRPVRQGFELEISNRTLTVGKEGELGFTLRNVSGGEVSDVEVVVSAATPLTVLGPSVFRAESIKAEGTFRFSTRVIASPTATEGVYRLTVSVTYKDRYGRLLSESREVGVLVKGFVLLKVFNLDVTTEDPASRLISVTGDLLNEGLSPSRTVWVELSGPDVISSTPSYLGDVQPGEQKSFSVEGKLRSDSGQVFLVFTYRDRFGDVQVHSVPLNVRIEGQVTRLETVPTTAQTDVAQSSFSVSVIVGIAAIIALFGYLALRRRSGRRGGGGERADQV